MPSSAGFEPLADDAAFRRGLSARLGLPLESWDALRFWTSGSGAVWASSRACTLAGLTNVEAVGMLVMRRAPPRGQLSTAFLRQWCADATRGVVTLDAREGARFLRGESVPTVLADAAGVVVKSAGWVLGRGRVADGVLHCEISKGLRADVGDTLL